MKRTFYCIWNESKMKGETTRNHYWKWNCMGIYVL